ncbi:HD domain-containing protein [Patescibacteria group bacterium]|nr:HD domain-containing protein [Patescibacteria group bacterium]
MSHNPVYSHFKGKISRAEEVERKVVSIILKSQIPDHKRAWSKTFELKHSSSVAQIGRILAQKRGLDSDLAAIICVLHDIEVNATGDAKQHAHKGALRARKMLEAMRAFSAKEIELIVGAIKHHSDKHIVSRNPYVELVKDADVFDCGLYAGVHDAYVFEKPLVQLKEYFARVKRVRKELGLPKDPQWDVFGYLKKHGKR